MPGLPRSRKTTSLSQPIHNQLNMYAFAASAAGVGMLAMALPADGEVVYTADNQDPTRLREVCVPRSEPRRNQRFYFLELYDRKQLAGIPMGQRRTPRQRDLFHWCWLFCCLCFRLAGR